MCEMDLTSEQEMEAQRIAKVVMELTQDEALRLGRMLAGKKNSELFGQTEFDVRDAVHRIGAAVFGSALQERKKRGTKGRR
jgi:hypothetical protein